MIFEIKTKKMKLLLKKLNLNQKTFYKKYIKNKQPAITKIILKLFSANTKFKIIDKIINKKYPYIKSIFCIFWQDFK